MSRVFVSQEPIHRDGSAVMDLTPALEFGQLEMLLPSGPVIFSTAPMINALKSKLEAFSDDDYLLGIGDPVAIAAAVMVASEKNNGKVKLLRWDRPTRRYAVISIDLYPNRDTK